MTSHVATQGHEDLRRRHKQFGWDWLTTASHREMDAYQELYRDIWVRIGHNRHLGLKGKHRAVSTLKEVLYRNA